MACRYFTIISSRLCGLLTNFSPTSHGLRHSRNLSTKSSRVSVSSLPEEILDTKGLDRIIFRPMREIDLMGVNKLIQTRSLVDFSETDVSSMLKSPQFIGVVAENEEHRIVGFGGVTRYTDDITAAGHMIVLDKYRNTDVSAGIMHYSRKHLFGKMVYSYGYDSLESYYDRIGFSLDKTFGLFHRMKGKFGEKFTEEKIERTGAEIHKAEEVDFEKLSLFDTRVHTQPRSEILHAMCFHPQSKAYVAINGSEIDGYVILRKCINGYKIAPLFANNNETARALYQRVSVDIPTGSVVAMVVTPQNDYFREFMELNEFEIVHSLWRSVLDSRSIDLPIDFKKVFSLTNSNFALC